MKVLVVGAGKMGSWFVESLCLEHEVAVYDKDLSRLKFFFRTLRLEKPEDIKEFNPDIVINAVSLQYTIMAFEEIFPFLSDDCIVSDITSVKNGLKDFYLNSGKRFVSIHPMFGPTFANVRDLSNENAIIISESDEMGKLFFKDFFSRVGLKIFEYSFRVHDQAIAYSLSIPFASSLVFASVMKKQEAPGTTFKKHMSIAKGLLGEDEDLLAEILLNPYTHEQIEKIIAKMGDIISLIKSKDKEGIKTLVRELRRNLDSE